ncbi:MULTISPECIES: group II truncated hemoglobin [Thiothrix]|mgnify:FL=1|jgi:hemoglobin|uniref:Group II truncated hemoglobin n=3 Tax=Thiothrix TaxID=1030 RepID=A0A975F9S3_9GAMM|nr:MULTISPECIES: group II truncated hemoglobin [Thiothrix]MDX9990166.1 group II truncated hemoglobin [Thiothrix unzii]OQX16518.1 MAG: globin [Thiothrix lacustris]QTR51199.1 group II truncated hemoglobin [Candidatus Thiothrix anitrata]QTR53633.1 group II truncated hemoglobin [Thiothrix unzii]
MELPIRTHYDMLGGEQGIRQLVNRFYDLMDELPEAWELRKIHQQDLQSARDKLFKFLSGWLGGPGLYEAEYGHPRLRARHMPFPVDTQMRDQWLMCINQALDEQVSDELFKLQLKSSFANVADHMRNRAG